MAVLTDVTSELEGAIDRLADVDPSSLADRESIIALSRQAERLAAVTARATAAVEASGSWQSSGAKCAAAWMVTFCNLAQGAARHRISQGRALRAMPVTEAAWLAGDISAAHVDRLCSARTPVTATVFARDEELLVDRARGFRFWDFTRVLTYWRQAADGAGAEADAAAQHHSRGVHLSQSYEARWFLDGHLDPIAGSILNTELNRLADQLYDQDLAQAKQAAGEGAVYELARTPAQRRADALVIMATRSAAMAPGARMPAPLFSVFVGYETLAGRICELADGTVISPGSLVPYLSEALVERIVFDGPSRVIDVGVKRRLFSGATRRAVEVRDRQCFHPLCDTPAEDCQIDHVEPYGAGGLTTSANGRPACGFHNRLRHRPFQPPVP